MHNAGVSQIFILDGDGTVIRTLDEKFRIHSASGIELSETEGDGYTEIRTSESTVVADALNQILADYRDNGRYITTINNSKASGLDGAFFINPADGCTSWVAASDVQINLDNSQVILEDSKSYTEADSEANIKLGGSGGGMYLYDTCPPCKNCDTYAQLMRLVEQLKMFFWRMKDVNLYTKAIVDSRQAWAEANRTSFPAVCNATTNNESEDFSINMDRLLGQYMTVVHMWNYLVSAIPNAVKFGAVPEDSSAFYIQTKYPRPTCDGSTGVYCRVQITPVLVQPHLVTWIPMPEFEFSPYGSMVSGINVNAEYIDASGQTTNCGGRCTLSHSSGTVAGTYMLTVRMYPYFHVEQYREGDTSYSPITPTNYVWNSSDDRTVLKLPDGGYRVIYNGSGITLDIMSGASVVPSMNDYVNSKNYLAYNSDETNIWEVEITWELRASDGTVKSESREHYYYKTPGVGTVMPSVASNSTYVTQGTGCFADEAVDPNLN